jgi:hypothetical protein
MRLFAAFLVVAAMNMTLAIVPAQARGFSFEDFFTGRTVAEGSFRAITGLQRRFTVALHGKWDGRTLTLREDFTFDDGTREHKTWRFVKTGADRYRCTREDVVGETLVKIDGNVARFTYLVYLDAANRRNKVRFHDTMTLKNDGTLLNSAYVTKIGLPVAWTRVEFRRR